jgi:hypothetical protein
MVGFLIELPSQVYTLKSSLLLEIMVAFTRAFRVRASEDRAITSTVVMSCEAMITPADTIRIDHALAMATSL